MTVAVKLVQGSAEWHAWRREGIGGSDAPAVEGISPYRTPLMVAMEKTGRPVVGDDDESKEFIFAQGHKTEALIRAQFRELTGAEMEPTCRVHPRFDYIRASLDGLDPKFGVLEGKMVGQAVLEAARKGTIPAHHYSQIQHQLAVVDHDRAQWFGHDGKKTGLLVEVKRDEEYIKRLLEQEHRFWSDLKAGKLPALSERDYLVPDDQTLLNELRDAKEHAENAAAAFEHLRSLAIAKYGHPRVAGVGIKLIRTKGRESFDPLQVPEVDAKTAKMSERIDALVIKRAETIEKTLAKLSPDYLAQFRKVGSPIWQVRIDAPKAAKKKEPAA